MTKDRKLIDALCGSLTAFSACARASFPVV